MCQDWNGPDSSLILFIASIVSVFHLDNIKSEFHNAVQHCVKTGMVQIQD